MSKFHSYLNYLPCFLFFLLDISVFIRKNLKVTEEKKFEAKKVIFGKSSTFEILDFVFVKTFHIPSFSGNGGPKYG